MAWPNDIIDKLNKSNVSLSDEAFSREIEKLVQSHLHSKENRDFVEAWEHENGFTLDDEDRDRMVHYLNQSSADDGDKKLAKALLPSVFARIRDRDPSALFGAGGLPALEEDYQVDYEDETTGTIDFNRKAVSAAAQLYFAMTCGDELGIFPVIDHIASRYLATGRVDIQEADVARDLQEYILNENFRDLKTGRVHKRVRPEERQMFYRQIFNAGQAELVEGTVVNSEFPRLWYNLMSQVARYIARVEDSSSGETLVSRQRVYQAIEDLQANLSASNTGLVRLGTPLIYKEMEFVRERFLKSKDILDQLSRHGSRSYLKVIERVMAELHGVVPNVNGINLKAKLSHMIISRISEFTPDMIEDDQKWGEFIGAVDALIGLQEEMEQESTAAPERSMPALPGLAPVGTGTNSGPSRDEEWNF